MNPPTEGKLQILSEERHAGLEEPADIGSPAAGIAGLSTPGTERVRFRRLQCYWVSPVELWANSG